MNEYIYIYIERERGRLCVYIYIYICTPRGAGPGFVAPALSRNFNIKFVWMFISTLKYTRKPSLQALLSFIGDMHVSRICYARFFRARDWQTANLEVGALDLSRFLSCKGSIPVSVTLRCSRQIYVRPIRLLSVWISEGLTQADS